MNVFVGTLLLLAAAAVMAAVVLLRFEFTYETNDGREQTFAIDVGKWLRSL